MSEYIWCEKRNQRIHVQICSTIKCGKRKKCEAWKLQMQNKKTEGVMNA